MGARMTIEDQIIELKMAASSMKRQSKKCKKAEKADKLKVKKAMQDGDKERAQIHASNSIRNKNNGINFLRMASRMEAIVQRLQTANSMKSMSQSMIQTTKIMKSALSTMNVQKITTAMDTFEKQFEELDVQSAVMEDAMKATNANTIPEDQVNTLMQQVADEHKLDLDEDMVPVPEGKLGVEKKEEKKAEVSLADRLAALDD